METVGQQKLWSFAERGEKAVPLTCSAVRHSSARAVGSFLDLAKKVAELQFMNRDLVLMFRGQSGDHKNKSGNTTLKPTIFRAKTATKVPTEKTLAARYAQLDAAEVALVGGYRSGSTPGSQRLRRQQILRWSILQHYEVCPTPLLDVTHSLRIAALLCCSWGCGGRSRDGYRCATFEWCSDSKCGCWAANCQTLQRLSALSGATAHSGRLSLG